MGHERAILFAALAALAGGVASTALAERALRPGGAQVWVASETEKLRPSAEPPDDTAPAIALDLAGNDCMGAQIAVRSKRAIAALSADAPPAQGPGVALPIALSRVATIALDKPSGPDGAAGEWPDALIPTVDALLHEERNAFPIDVAPFHTQAIFVEACAPAGQPAGRYATRVRLRWTEAGRARSLEVPLGARVRPFALPATPPLATAFGFSGYSAARGHGLPASDARELTRLYDLAALRRGLTLFGGTQDPPARRPQGDTFIIDWRGYDAEVGPFLDGTALPSGARWTAVELREPAKLSRDERREWRRQWVAHFRARGWLDRLFAYVTDEPEPSKFAEVQAKAAEMASDAPELRRLVTTALAAELPAVDRFTPLLNCFEPAGPSASCARPVPRSAYPTRPWWYQSCASHGCGKTPSTDAGYRGWPSYAIDAAGPAARAMGALAFAHHIAGELYYDTVLAYDGGDPWREEWRFGGNGDGTLYYPGRPEMIGGAHHVPVESLRLVLIARSLGDHAALALVRDGGDAALANRLARELAPSLRGFSRDPAAYARARSQLYDRLEELAAHARSP